MLNNEVDNEGLDFEYSEVTTGIQLACLDILREIHRVCVENGIKYTLGAGTIIGYKLFGGYIPWDDDIDLLMTRTEYERFLQVFPQKCSERYHLEHYRTSNDIHALYAKVYDRTTTIIERPKEKYIKSGAFVDISVLDGVQNEAFHKEAIKKGKIAYALLYTENEITKRVWWKQFLIEVFLRIASDNNKKRIYEWYEKYCMRYNDDDFDKYAELMVLGFWNSLYDKCLFDDYILVKFEDVETYIIKEYDKFLIQKYNKSEFVRNQPKEKRQKSHSIYFTNKIGYEQFDLDEFTSTFEN